MKLTILGSSSALPTSERYPSAHVLNVHEHLFLIDCGEGTQMQLRKCRIRFGKINNIFISHLHGDHVFGLYGLLSTFNLMGRTVPLSLFAPASYMAKLSLHLHDFDINLNFQIDFHPLAGKEPVQIFENKHMTVTSFPLKHRIEAFGFLFREKPAERNIIRERIEELGISVAQIRAIKKGSDFVAADGRLIKNSDLTLDPEPPLSYAYCSDTAYFRGLAGVVRNVDLLYHEATFATNMKELARQTGHSTAADAAKTARAASAGTLIIGHFSARYRDIDPLVEEARTIFPSTIPALDGFTYDIAELARRIK